jgi:hypothetical protein
MEKEVIVDGKVINLEVLLLLPRFGTQLVSKNSVVWEEPSIVGPIAVYWSTTLLTSEYALVYAVFRQHRVMDH